MKLSSLKKSGYCGYVSALCCCGGSGMQPTQLPNHPQGFYASLNGGVSFVDADTAGFGAGGYLGYQFNPYFAVEGGVTAALSVFGDVSIADVAAKGILPLGDHMTVFAKAGVAYTTIRTDFLFINASASQITPFLGAGLGYALSPSLTITAQYNGALLNNDNTNSKGLVGVASLGLDWHFNQ